MARIAAIAGALAAIVLLGPGLLRSSGPPELAADIGLPRPQLATSTRIPATTRPARKQASRKPHDRPRPREEPRASGQARTAGTSVHHATAPTVTPTQVPPPAAQVVVASTSPPPLASAAPPPPPPTPVAAPAPVIHHAPEFGFEH